MRALFHFVGSLCVGAAMFFGLFAYAQFAAGERKEPGITSYKIEHLGNVLEFKLEDGTRCVVVQKSGSITCDWR